MIGPTGAVNVMAATKPVDFRKGAEGLAALVRETMFADPFLCVAWICGGAVPKRLIPR
ncbi:transposase [Mesorhizobium sp. M0114]|uniref:IS66 family insertion sequence element accessory protein TnpB n=1 Tax=unclassified Mesorhizobium TaxID=325217 RepID=UPI00333C3B30